MRLECLTWGLSTGNFYQLEGRYPAKGVAWACTIQCPSSLGDIYLLGLLSREVGCDSLEALVNRWVLAF